MTYVDLISLDPNLTLLHQHSTCSFLDLASFLLYLFQAWIYLILAFIELILTLLIVSQYLFFTLLYLCWSFLDLIYSSVDLFITWFELILTLLDLYMIKRLCYWIDSTCIWLLIPDIIYLFPAWLDFPPIQKLLCSVHTYLGMPRFGLSSITPSIGIVTRLRQWPLMDNSRECKIQQILL